MSLRTRVATIAAAAVAVAFLGAATTLYLTTARTLRGAVDQSIVQLAEDLARDGFTRPSPFGPRPGPLGGAGGFVQVVTADGRVLVPTDAPVEPLPVSDRAHQVALGRGPSFFQTMEVHGEPVRILTLPVAPTAALQVARPLDEVEASLARLRRRLALAGLGGIALAGVLGTVVARRALRPVRHLTDLAEEVARTQDLTRRIGEHRRDELGRLARAFDTMLGNLADARRAQEQLIADASHELRTPLTSLRTNVEVLADAEQLPLQDRRELITEVVGQLDEFGRLVSALVELARGRQPLTAATPLRLDEVVERAVVGLGSVGGGRLRLELEPSVVAGEADRLERAAANLIDNALKYSDGPVEVSVAGGCVRVRDYGPGLPSDSDRLFERFYRAPEARAAPGSGLGLAIARQVAVVHAGSLRAENAHGGGAVFTLCIPTHGG